MSPQGRIFWLAHFLGDWLDEHPRVRKTLQLLLIAAIAARLGAWLLPLP